MNSIAEIELAIEKLPASQVEELASWLEAFRTKRTDPSRAESWLQQARGVAIPGATTANILALTRSSNGGRS